MPFDTVIKKDFLISDNASGSLLDDLYLNIFLLILDNINWCGLIDDSYFFDSVLKVKLLLILNKKIFYDFLCID